MQCLCDVSVCGLSDCAHKPITAPAAHRTGALLRVLDRLRVEDGIHLLRRNQARAVVACIAVCSLGTLHSWVLAHDRADDTHCAQSATTELFQISGKTCLLLGRMPSTSHASMRPRHRCKHGSPSVASGINCEWSRK